ncbi:MAG: cytochrome c [Planctomycetota bacterium]
MKKYGTLLGIILLALPIVPACDDSSRPDVDMSKKSHFGFQTSISTSLMEEGKVAYANYCVGCHGVNGDGVGEAALFLNPKPRNFVVANFKFSSTRSGQMPTDDDLRRTLKKGLRGSAMPSFKLLPDRTVDSLIGYIKTFSPRWQESDVPTPIPVVDDPYRKLADKSEAVRRGEAVYHGYATCWSCHPAYVEEKKVNEYIVAFGGMSRESFRPGMKEAVGKDNVEGELLYPPDFRHDYVRGGMTVDDIYRSVSAGISGTAMPTWVDSIDVAGKKPGDPPLVSRADLWAMAYYVQHLIIQRPPLMEESRVVIRDRARPIYLHGAPPKPKEQPATSQPSEKFDF